MSDSTRVVGHLTITPPLNWAEIRSTRFYTAVAGGRHSGNMPDMILQVDSREVETDEGVNTVLSSQFVVPCTDSRYRLRSLTEDVKELCETFKDHEVRGELTLWGEDYGDIRRVVVDEDGVREEKATLSWPDGSEVELP